MNCVRKIIKGDATRRNIKETTSTDFSIQGVHDGTTEIKYWSYSITRLIESKRVRHRLISRQPSHDACWVEVSGSFLSSPPAVPKTWKVDDFQPMPLRASNWASSSINPAESISGAKVC